MHPTAACHVHHFECSVMIVLIGINGYEHDNNAVDDFDDVDECDDVDDVDDVDDEDECDDIDT